MNIDESIKTIYCDLEELLKKLNKRSSFRLYTVIFSNEKKIHSCYRTRQSLSKRDAEMSVYPEKLKEENICNELKLADDFLEILKQVDSRRMKSYIDLARYSKWDDVPSATTTQFEELSSANDEVGATIEGKSERNYNVLYCSTEFSIDPEYRAIFLIEIRNIDEDSIDLFYNNPSYSFLRMVLDNIFFDYYSKESIWEKKYNEDITTFLRRIARLYFGKIQNNLKENMPSSKNEIKEQKGLTFNNDNQNQDISEIFNNRSDNTYYTFDLFEDIEDISNKTYEGTNPFGSILFLSKNFDKETKIKFAIEFQESNRIKLSDSKRIRKLLEITNCDKELYLIANDEEILGVGEVEWNSLIEEIDFLIRVDFNGLAKYNLMYLYTRVKNYTDGEIIEENNKKLYRSSKNLEIIENNLVSVSFKNPTLKQQQYSPEKFEKIFKSQFTLTDAIDDEKAAKTLEKIKLLINIAKEQKHGTMVVIAKPETTISELKILGAQSTLIKPTEMESDNIKYLTAIDGAIYLDTDGKCHAIGVILDGLAKEDEGDPCRGARYNSAIKYLNKISLNNDKCVIVVISEDGMIDIIPDLENERIINNIIEEIINIISEGESEEDNQLSQYEKQLEPYKQSIEHYLYFEIAKAFYDKKNYKKADQYYGLGFDQNKDGCFVTAEHYNLKGNSLHYIGEESLKIENYEEAVKCYKEALLSTDNVKDKSIYYINMGNSYYQASRIANKRVDLKQKEKNFLEQAIISYEEHIRVSEESERDVKPGIFNVLGICYDLLGRITEDKDSKDIYYKKAIVRYTQAISISKGYVYYWNRGIIYKRLSNWKDALEDFIMREILLHEPNKGNEASSIENIKEIKSILDKQGHLAEGAFEFYKEQRELYSVDIIDLEKLIEGYIVKNKDVKINSSTEE